ncbi:6-bladed beta-propeller [Parabacteroides sp. AM08-6]|uniref:6-bladed beta-propeller n=1 Tax=Parabacteroides sp. AM08-6 TaxID=2292053 RepID=UPI000EFE21F5|nr:6-bladed beta-propeller [Parabacteroides sp. AM08-6]RHJ78515.1 6-bladed beta-propeller [Parabacteroides sp. AM08-6]
MRIFTIFFLLFVSVLSCNSRSSSDSSKDESALGPLDKVVTYPVTVDLPTALQDVDEKVSLSTFVESIEYIPLKLKDNYLRNNFQACYYDEKAEKIIISDYEKAVVVNKKGDFLNRIGSVGQGPSEYIYLAAISTDPSRQKVYIYDGRTRSLKRYGYDGVFERIVFKSEVPFIHFLFYYDDNFITKSNTYFYEYYQRKMQDKLYGYSLCDTLGHLIDTTPHLYHRLKDIAAVNYIQPIADNITRCKDVMLMVEGGLADTINTVSGNKITPRYFLKYGEGTMPDINKLWHPDNKVRVEGMNSSFFINSPAYETPRYFFIKGEWKREKYIICHDKYKNRSFSVKYRDDTPEIKENELHVNIGFRNDIDGGFDAYIGSVSSLGNYWVAYVDAYAMKTLLTDKHFASRKDVLDKAAQEKLKALVKNLNDEDDPVLMLMKVRDNAK